MSDGQQIAATVQQFLAETWAGVQPFFTVENISLLLATFATAGAGAYFGGRAMQSAAERAKAKDDLTKEMRSVNAGLALLFSICNSHLNLKEQHVAPLKKAYDEHVSAHRDFVERNARGEADREVFEVVTDYRTLSPMNAPVDRLQVIVFDELSVTGRSLNIADTLAQTARSLDHVISERNNFIAMLSRQNLPTNTRMQLYLGLPDAEGNVNQTYPNFMEAIYDLTDDCIQFSLLLIDDLREYGDVLCKRYKRKRFGQPPRISEPNFTKAEEKGLMPPRERYADWEAAFIKGD